MTRIQLIRDTLRKICDESTDEQIAGLILDLCQEEILDPEELYPLWCDNQGPCRDRGPEEVCCCDEEHIGCIVRFLQGEYTPEDASEPRGV